MFYISRIIHKIVYDNYKIGEIETLYTFSKYVVNIKEQSRFQNCIRICHHITVLKGIFLKSTSIPTSKLHVNHEFTCFERTNIKYLTEVHIF